jgi:hypothetical protein
LSGNNIARCSRFMAAHAIQLLFVRHKIAVVFSASKKEKINALSRCPAAKPVPLRQ